MKFFNFFLRKRRKPEDKQEIKPVLEEKAPIIAKKKHNLISLSKRNVMDLFGKWITAGAEKCRICNVPLVKNNPKQIVYYCSKICRRKRININY